MPGTFAVDLALALTLTLAFAFGLGVGDEASETLFFSVDYFLLLRGDRKAVRPPFSR